MFIFTTSESYRHGIVIQNSHITNCTLNTVYLYYCFSRVKKVPLAFDITLFEFLNVTDMCLNFAFDITLFEIINVTDMCLNLLLILPFLKSLTSQICV